MEYYTYILIDPRNNKIFYVGKGKKQRMYKHVMDVQRGRIPNGSNVYLERKIKKILSSGNKVKYKKVLITENQQEAFVREKELIKKFGLKNLCNVASGGIGSNGNKGRTFTAEHRKKISDAVKIAMANLPNDVKLRIDENRARPFGGKKDGNKGNKSNFGRQFTTDHKKNLSNSLKKYWENKQ